MVVLDGDYSFIRDMNNKKQIRTNFDLRNSSDLLRLVTRTGISPLANIRTLYA